MQKFYTAFIKADHAILLLNESERAQINIKEVSWEFVSFVKFRE